MNRFNSFFSLFSILLLLTACGIADYSDEIKETFRNACTSHDDCEKGFYCDFDNQCKHRPECSSQSECPAGFVCKTEEGFCDPDPAGGGGSETPDENADETPDEVSDVTPEENADETTEETPEENSGGETDWPECSPESVTPCFDPSSGLVWSAKASDKKPFGEAVSYCADLKENGFSGWHLPDINELRTLIQNCAGTVTGGACGVVAPDHLRSSDYSSSCACTKNDEVIYSRTGDTEWFWSSSEMSGSSAAAWGVGFGNAAVTNHTKESKYNVRCVRTAGVQ